MRPRAADQASVSEPTGSLSFAVPLPVSVARGSEPRLELGYSSGEGHGLFGLGFSLSQDSIRRRTSLGTPRYDESDVFVLSSGDELVPSSSERRQLDGKPYTVTRMRPRVEDFEKIELFVNDGDASDRFWRVIDSTNAARYYGRTSQARVYDPQDASRVFEWLLEEYVDARGDRVCWRYMPDGPERLPLSVVYGNATPGGEDWRFEAAFDYGPRQDATRSYEAGFERGCRQLCRTYRMLHRFPELPDDPTLVRLVRFVYDEAPSLSLLRRVEESAFADGRAEALPPLELTWSPFGPAAAPVESVATPGAEPLDLDGLGVPGLFLGRAEGGPLYWPPRSGGGYDPSRALNWPTDDGALADVLGQGRPGVLRQRPPAGFYPAAGEGFAPFQALPAFPADAQAPGRQFSDMTGAGLHDLVTIGGDGVTVYPSLGALGYGTPLQKDAPAGLPATTEPGPLRFLAFSAFFGTGGSHRLRVTRDSVTVWPHLGYGKFGEPLSIAGAPDFGADFDAARVLLCDVDGSGTPDVAYVRTDRVDIYLNRCGASLSPEPLSVPLPVPCGSPSQVAFADLLGAGYDCMVFTESQPQPGQQPRRWRWDFCGGTKPYMLTGLDDNGGLRIAVSYLPSTRYALSDKAAGRPWATCLPFPVQVVSAIDTFDLVTGTKATSSFTYGHGFYDPAERQFRGFGRVERADTEVLLGTPQPADPGPEVTPAALTRTWYFTGAPGDRARFASEFYAGDPQAWAPPDDFLDLKGTPDDETLRQAYAALHGKPLREEAYGLDSPAPYGVTDLSYWVRLEQPRDGASYAVLSLHERESVDYDYERVPQDPRITHEYLLAVDEKGQPLRSCTLAYPRRPGAPDAVAEQLSPRLREADIQYAPPREGDDELLFGLVTDMRTYEVAPPPLAGPLSAAQLTAYLAQGPATTLLSWRRQLYYDGPQGLLERVLDAELEAGQAAQLFGSLALGQSLDDFLGGRCGYILDQGYWWKPGLRAVYGGPFDMVASVTDALGTSEEYAYDAHNLLVASVRVRAAGVLDSTATMGDFDYVNLCHRSLRDDNGAVHETRADAFGRPIAASRRKPGEPGFAPLSAWSRPEELSVAQALEAPDACLQGASTFRLYDDLAWCGRARASSFPETGLWDDLVAHGWISQEGALLCAFRSLAGPEGLTLSPQFAPLRDSAYARLAAAPRGQPTRDLVLLALAYPGAADWRAGALVTHYDGLEREVQASTLVEPGPAFLIAPDGSVSQGQADPRWRNTGGVLYDNKGRPFKEYEPYFVGSPWFVTQPELARFGVGSTLRRDALGAIVRRDEPRGPLKDCGVYATWSRGPWSTLRADRNDTVRDSPLYKLWIEGPPPAGVSPFELDALTKAAAHDGTPHLEVLDNLGRVTRVSSQAAQGGPWLASRAGLDTLGRELWSADPRLDASGKRNFERVYSLGGQALVTRSPDSGTRLTLKDALGRFALGQDGRGFLALHSYDGLGRPTAIRVAGGDGAAPLDNVVARRVYGDSVDDSGATPLPSPESANLRGRLYRRYDAAGLVEHPAYDFMGCALRADRRLRADYAREADWSGTGTWSVLLPRLDSRLETAPPFASTSEFDALQRPRSWTDPVGHVHGRAYTVSGLLAAVTLDGAACARFLDYDAKDRPASVLHGNGVRLQVDHEPDTDRPKRFRCWNGQMPLQDLTYYYDPEGNITHVENAVSPVPGPKGGGDLDHRYDAFYRLTSSSGRALSGLSPEDESSAAYDPFFAGRGVERYSQAYDYDDGSNLLRLAHSAPSGGWTQEVTVDPGSNRGVDARLASERPVAEWFDAGGNLKGLASDRPLAWNWRDNIASAQGPDGLERYVYDGGGRRRRKVLEAPDGSVLSDTVYLGDVELVRAGGTTRRRVLAGPLERLEWQDGSRPPEERYHLTDALDCRMLELGAGAALLSYEEYLPYGGTALAAGPSLAEAALKTRRYSGQERDAFTGLYYYGHRYYAPWLGRWLSADPADDIDGLNVYAFASCNPTTFADEAGLVGRLKANRGGRGPKKMGKAHAAVKKAKKQRQKKDYGDTPTRASPRNLTQTNLDILESVKKGMHAPRGGSLGSRVTGNKRNIKLKTHLHGAWANTYMVKKALKDKSYKHGTERFWWKGEMIGGHWTGVPIYPIASDGKRSWPSDQKKATQRVGAKIEKMARRAGINNGDNTWFAEASHLLAHSLHGPNDMLSAFSANVHQNTEVLALEIGLKRLAKKFPGAVKVMITGYVTGTGFLRAARYKILINGNKVFDHLTLGNRPNIELSEATALTNKVSALTASDSASLHGTAFKGVDPKTILEIDMAGKSSVNSPVFGGSGPSGKKRRPKAKSLAHAKEMWRKGAEDGPKEADLTRYEPTASAMDTGK